MSFYSCGDNEGLQPQEAVDAMVKVSCLRSGTTNRQQLTWRRKRGNHGVYVFSESNETDPERLLVQVRDTFEKAKQWEQETLAKKFGDDLPLHGRRLMKRMCWNLSLIRRLKLLNVYSLGVCENLRQMSREEVFEDFLSKTFRDDLGQYFTPTPVINLMVGILQPTVDDYMGHPACGSARM